ncbi:MAG: DUF2809 domain-containing protein [Bacteroidales bacterium]|nr:DUF2809 domain-containing protein [Bacteroidales bacterium]
MKSGVQSIRWLTAVILAAVVVGGIFALEYTGPGHLWIRFSLGGFLYELFWCLLAFLLFPRLRPLNIALTVFIATCLLEILQLWQNPLIQQIRETFAGKILLGNRFNVWDFPWYLTGSLAGWGLMKRIRRYGQKADQPVNM